VEFQASTYSAYHSPTNQRVLRAFRGPRVPRTRQADTWRAFLAPLVTGVLLGALAVLAYQAMQQNRHAGPSGGVTESSSATSEATNLQVTMSAGLLAALIQDAAARGRIPLQISDVHVQTETDRLTVNGDVSVLGGAVSGSAVFEPYVEDGRLAMHVVRAQFGALPIPSDIALLAEQPMNDRIAAAIGGLPATITGVKVETTGVTVSAHVSTDRRASSSRVAVHVGYGNQSA
jgi:hypothetical protein